MKILIIITLLLIIAIRASYGKSNDTFETGNAAIFPFKSDDISIENTNNYTETLKLLLQKKTGWEILSHKATTQIIKEQNGDLSCSKIDCAVFNGQYLNVDYVIFGTVQTIGKHTSINVQIANVSTGRLISDITIFSIENESRFSKKVLPRVAERLGKDIMNIQTVSVKRANKDKSSTKKVSVKSKNGAFSDLRKYLSYSDKHDPSDSFSTDAKMAFGYLTTSDNMYPDDLFRYSFQLQSYLSEAGAHDMLYFDEMELLIQKKDGNLKCQNRKCASKIGRLLGVNFMGYGKISKIGKNFIFRAYLVNTESGKKVTSVFKLYRGKEETFLTEVIPEVAEQLGNSFSKFKNDFLTVQKDDDAFSDLKPYIVNK